MKKIIFIASVFILLVSFACTTDNDLDQTINNPENIEVKSINSLSWENFEIGVLPSGLRVKLPWCEAGALTTIPDDIRKDIKKMDGWIILDTTVGIDGFSTPVTASDPGANYLVLYNKVTGVLKGFYYAETIQANNCGIWSLQTSTSTKLFNFAEYFAKPFNKNANNQIYLANITTNGETKGFELGWNCFMIELAYDPSSDIQKLNISGMAMNRAKITMTGAYQSKSSGSILVSTSPPSGVNDWIASGVGKEGAQWIADEMKKDEKNKVLKFAANSAIDVLTNGIRSIISLGLNKVFGSVAGSVLNYDLKFSTSGEIKMQGELINSSSGLIKPITGLRLGTADLDLGIWNIQEEPIYLTENPIELTKCIPLMGGTQYNYRVKRLIQAPQLILNPLVSTGGQYITTSAVSYEKYGSKVNPCKIQRSYKKIASLNVDSQPKVLYKDSVTCIAEYPSIVNYSVMDAMPNYSDSQNKPVFMMEYDSFDVFDNTAIKVVFNSYTPHEGRTIQFQSSKTFVPSQQFKTKIARPKTWTYSELKLLGY